MNQIKIIAKNITAQWRGNRALNDVSFELSAGENLLITGDSGSGKTLLAKALAKKIFYRGSVAYFENDAPVTPAVLFVEQHYHFRNLSNTQNFYYQQRFNSFDAEDALTVTQELQSSLTENSSVNDDSINSLLSKFDLLHCANSPLLQLSSGEHKRFQLVKALLQSPDVLILDEPFIGLDVQSRKQLCLSIDELSAKGTKCILICTPSNAPACITHIAQLEAGVLKTFSHKAIFNLLSADHAVVSLNNIPEEAPVSHFSNAVVFTHVSVAYGNKKILNDINWQVKRGDKWLLKGHNGAGKSTLLSLITGDNPQAYANEIYLFGKRRGTGESIWDIKKNIGFVSPELQWYFDTTVSCYQAIASGLFDTIGLFRILNKAEEEKVYRWLAYFGIEKYAHQLLSALPAGKQRIALLARAMVKNPPVLILDEPCQGLDQQQKEHFLQLTEAICRHTERTLIYVSHYSEDVPRCVDKVIELDRGNASIYAFNPFEKNAIIENQAV